MILTNLSGSHSMSMVLFVIVVHSTVVFALCELIYIHCPSYISMHTSMYTLPFNLSLDLNFDNCDETTGSEG
jgi:hypothetical protein